MTVLCGVIPPRLVKTEEWATEDDWLVYELAQKQRKGIQERFFNRRSSSLPLTNSIIKIFKRIQLLPNRQNKMEIVSMVALKILV